MTVDRRALIVGAGCSLVGCSSTGGNRPKPEPEPEALDRLLLAHAEALPERPGAGANHYPMAAEALCALGQAGTIAPDWTSGAAGYAGDPALTGRRPGTDGLGDPVRFGDWREHFRAALERDAWQAVVAEWAPRLAPGLAGGAFHGLIRTGHATRALRERDTPARRGELANGLAYWAARYTLLPIDTHLERLPRDPARALLELPYPARDDLTDVDFFAVDVRLTQMPLAPPAELAEDPAGELDALVQASATAFLEWLVEERHRLWLLHTVTGPAAAGLILPELERDGARLLVAHARQATLALHNAFGAPFQPRAHLRPAPPDWSELVTHAAASRSVHTVKLLEVLRRHDTGSDPLPRSVAVHWLEWV